MSADTLIWLAAVGPSLIVLICAFCWAHYLAVRDGRPDWNDFVEITEAPDAGLSGFSSPAGA